MVRDAYLRQVIENIVTHEANLSVAEYGKKCGGRMGGGDANEHGILWN